MPNPTNPFRPASPGYPYPPMPPRPVKKSHTLRTVLLTLLAGFGALIVLGIAVGVAGGPASTAPATAVPPAPPAVTPSPSRAAQPTVTYVVTGSAPAGDLPANVTYGPAGSDANGTVPLNVSQPIPASEPDYYSLTVQLSDAGGSVTCQILVDGKVVDQQTASGAYQIANCEISQDPFSGKWESTNNG